MSINFYIFDNYYTFRYPFNRRKLGTSKDVP